ncbi:MAG: uracil-DNA glycosylase [Flavobacteriales bacterium]|nr:MAG: uracil-DNA glycosylase [Flavobacteriales bacterium]
MRETLHPIWRESLKHIWEQEWYINLEKNIHQAYQDTRCYPPQELIFNAFNLCLPQDIRVVIIGQDPYHGIGQAHGLSFSVPNGIAHPPSLVNIFREIASDLEITPHPWGDLERWAVQGVFLLNSSLSVEAGKAGSHAKLGWEKFTDAVIQYIDHHCEDVIFMLWGGHAQKKSRLINPKRHHILSSGHPSPLSANRGYWFGNKHFSRANTLLQKPIDWR